MQCSAKTLSQIARKRLSVWLLYPYANRDKIKHNKQANKVLFRASIHLIYLSFGTAGN